MQRDQLSFCYVLMETTSQKSDLSKPDITSQEHSMKPSSAHYIYRKIHKNQKEQIPLEEFALLKKTIS